MRFAHRVGLIGLLLLCAAAAMATRAAAADNPLAAARKLYLTGKYAEAAESYELLAAREPAAAALGIARCAAAVGDLDKADKTLGAAAGKYPRDARFPSERASLALERGELPAAQVFVDAALKLDAEQPLARWVGAEILRRTGRLAEADKAYAWFIDFYNRTDKFTDPDVLRVVGLASAQNARWRRIHDQFSFLVNELYPDVLKLEPDYWPAHLEAGLLFLEKYNQPDAMAEFKAALKINPNAAEVYTAMARLALQNYSLGEAKSAVDEALKINPRLLAAHQLKADIELSNFDPAAAEQILLKALPLSPTDEGTLGRLAAARGCLDGFARTGPDSRMEQLCAEAEKRNPHCGEFYAVLGESLDSLRRYPQSAHYLAEAIRVMPQLTVVYGELGLVEMRLGQEAEGRRQLEQAFKVDFGNVRVKNSLEVLDVLDTYATLQTAHFVVRYDPQKDALQARSLAGFLEEVYPQLTKQLGYEPQGKTLFEIFNDAKNTKGHAWFSARTVGLPHIHTIAACVGRMVAMVSPSAMDKEFNWARVVKHEFVHVINLQQTGYAIPHWYTEALAVYNEGYPRSDDWNEMLTRRVPAGKVFNLETINLGFIHPESSEDWQMAYCQAEMYAEYMLRRFGDDALAKMLAGYAANLNTPAAIRRAFGVSVPDFEQGYTKFVHEIVARLRTAPPPPAGGLPELLHAVKEDPKNPDKLAALALAYLERDAYPKAGELAHAALAIRPKHAEATYVLARLDLLIGNTDGVADRLAAALVRERPNSRLLKLLAGLKYKSGDYAAAEEFYRLGQERFSSDSSWTKLLAKVYLKTNNLKRLKPVLVAVAEHDADELGVRKKLAELSLAEKDYAGAARWAAETEHVNVTDVDAHRIRAEALVAEKQYDVGLLEYEDAVELAPEQPALRLALAEAYLTAGKPGKSRQALAKLRKIFPKYPDADALEKKLKP